MFLITEHETTQIASSFHPMSYFFLLRRYRSDWRWRFSFYRISTWRGYGRWNSTLMRLGFSICFSSFFQCKGTWKVRILIIWLLFREHIILRISTIQIEKSIMSLISSCSICHRSRGYRRAMRGHEFVGYFWILLARLIPMHRFRFLDCLVLMKARIRGLAIRRIGWFFS